MLFGIFTPLRCVHSNACAQKQQKLAKMRQKAGASVQTVYRCSKLATLIYLNQIGRAPLSSHQIDAREYPLRV